MRVNEVIQCDRSCFVIYVTQQEHDDPSFQTKVDEYKKTCNDVSVFINGPQHIGETFKKIIREY